MSNVESKSTCIDASSHVFTDQIGFDEIMPTAGCPSSYYEWLLGGVRERHPIHLRSGGIPAHTAPEYSKLSSRAQ